MLEGQVMYGTWSIPLQYLGLSKLRPLWRVTEGKLGGDHVSYSYDVVTTTLIRSTISGIGPPWVDHAIEFDKNLSIFTL